MADKPDRPKRSPVEQAAWFNGGGAYAAATGDYMGGIGLVNSRSRDLKADPTNQRMLAGANVYIAAKNAYLEKVNEWKANGSQGAEPQLEMTPELARAKFHYENLIETGNVRSEIFQTNYQAMTVEQAQNLVFYNGRLPKGTPESIARLVSEEKTKKVSETDGKLKQTTEAFQNFYALGSVAKDVQQWRLINDLERIATE